MIDLASVTLLLISSSYLVLGLKTEIMLTLFMTLSNNSHLMRKIEKDFMNRKFSLNILRQVDSADSKFVLSLRDFCNCCSVLEGVSMDFLW